MTPKIIYILSFARSGSTLMGNIFNSADTHFHVGEFERLWLRLRRSAIKRNRRCGCSELVPDCEVWTKVFEITDRALGLSADESAFDVFERAHLQPPSWDSTLGHYQGQRPELHAFLVSVYPAIAEVTGSEWIVDSSKSLSYLELLRTVFPDEQIHVVHLVRDIRGIVASRMRSMREKREMSFIRQLPPTAKDVVDWQRFNKKAESAFGGMEHYSLVRYDDFVRDLRGVMTGTLADLGYQLSADSDRVVLPVNHTVGGNRSRMATGEVVLIEDLRWKTELSPLIRRMVTTVSSRSLRHYGFVR